MEATMKRFAALFALTFTAACASAANDSPQNATRGSTSAAATSDAVSVLRAGGTFAFSLDESDPSSRMRESCNTSEPSDPATCYAKIRAQGAKEKIKFTTDGAGHVVFTSFGPEEGADVVWIEVPLDLKADGPNAAVASAAGEFKGAWAAKMLAASPRFRFEVDGATTVVMSDPKKGRLVFHKE
jgi:hypothetical protein